MHNIMFLGKYINMNHEDVSTDDFIAFQKYFVVKELLVV